MYGTSIARQGWGIYFNFVAPHFMEPFSCVTGGQPSGGASHLTGTFRRTIPNTSVHSVSMFGGYPIPPVIGSCTLTHTYLVSVAISYDIDDEDFTVLLRSYPNLGRVDLKSFPENGRCDHWMLTFR